MDTFQKNKCFRLAYFTMFLPLGNMFLFFLSFSTFLFHVLGLPFFISLIFLTNIWITFHDFVFLKEMEPTKWQCEIIIGHKGNEDDDVNIEKNDDEKSFYFESHQVKHYT